MSNEALRACDQTCGLHGPHLKACVSAPKSRDTSVGVRGGFPGWCRGIGDTLIPYTRSLRGSSSTEVNPGLQAESSRNDTGFLAITLAAFVLPALLILSIAVGTGYLDKLAGGYGTGM